MFGYTIIKNSELELLRYKELEYNRYRSNEKSNLHWRIILSEKLWATESEITDLKCELLKYKELYADELQKRLALADVVRESEVKTEE